VANLTRRIGLSLGADICWPICFEEILKRLDLAIAWRGDTLRFEVSSTCAWWVVYTEPAHGLCVEPQSGPPDALNGPVDIVEPRLPLIHEMRWRWTRG